MANDKSIFPEDMINKSSGNTAMSLEEIASQLTYFHEQLHLMHWQTTNKAQHEALGALYEYIQDFKDDVIEKLMGYTNKRIKAYRINHLLKEGLDPKVVVGVVETFAHSLYEWAEEQKYCDIENIAQDLSGKAAKTKYLLTLS